MKLEIKKAPIEQKHVLKNLLELYVYDFTEFGPYDVNADGLFGYPHLDGFFTNEGWDPYLVYVDDKIAGFVLVVKDMIEELNEEAYSIAEFFIMKKYRSGGIGKKVATYIFDQYHGLWELDEMETNKPAQAFWRKVINEYTNGNYEEIRRDHWNGPIQRFRN